MHDSFPSFDSSTDTRIFCGSDSQFWISDLYSLLFYSLQTPTALCTDKQLQPTSLRATMAHLLFSTPDLTQNYDIQTTVKRILTVEKAPFWRQPSEKTKPLIWSRHLPVNERRRKYRVGDGKRRKVDRIPISVSFCHSKQMISLWTVHKFTIFITHTDLSLFSVTSIISLKHQTANWRFT